ncbi:hypothetical protein [Paenibacillus sp. FSL R5-808]|uniref:hypothetical protein n=2 Tax=Bacillota TaxID=1239 RepID=UPI0003E1F9DC|nr:hypothetical protein [Paenibacillus sp. FSL R5-808]ETT31322.1 hypothetical protein C169_24643 [Paenibacillus sp. FSL R5-808]
MLIEPHMTVTYSKGFTTVTERLDNNRLRTWRLRGRVTDKYDGLGCKRFGEIIETGKFIELVTKDGLPKDDRFMMIYPDMKQMKACTTNKALQYYKDFAAHFIPNGFYRWNDRGNENLRHVRWMTFDFELLKSNGKSFAPMEVFEIFSRGGYEPAFIAPSRSGSLWHVYIAISEMTGHTESIYLYQRIQRYLAEKFDCDLDAVGPAHSFAIPPKAWFFGLVVHNVDDMKNEWLAHLRKKNQEEKDRRKMISFKEEQVWKHEAIQALMNCDFNGSRMHACFTLALLFYALGKSKEEAYAFLDGEWYPEARKKGVKPFYPSEVRKGIKSAYSGKYRGPKREYIEALTGIEFNLNIYGSRVRKVDPRTGDYRKTKNENVAAIIDFIRENGGAVEMFQKDIIAQLQKKGFAERSLKRHFKALQVDGIIIANEARGGKNAKAPTYRLLETEIEEHQTTIEFDDSYRVPNRFLGVKNPEKRALKSS